MRALCRTAAHDPQETFSWTLLDHLIGKLEDARGNSEAERLGGLEIDDQRVFRRLLNREVGGAGAPEEGHPRLYSLRRQMHAPCADTAGCSRCRCFGARRRATPSVERPPDASSMNGMARPDRPRTQLAVASAMRPHPNA
jgi:hypothetical protein